MAINIAIFVPEGMVIASDCLSFMRNVRDDGFSHTHTKRTFGLFNKYAISFCDNGYAQGLPYGYYVAKFQQDNWNLANQRPAEVASAFVKYLTDFHNLKDFDKFYIAGYDKLNNQSIPYVAFYESNELHVVNIDKDNNSVYNFHAIGETYWLYKILLNTKIIEDKSEVEFGNIDIDFTKYSIADAEEFAKSLILISAKLDYLAQFSNRIGENVTLATITLMQGVEIKDL